MPTLRTESPWHAVAVGLTRESMDEVDETARRRARERLTADEHVAALLASGDPAAERAALALASTLARGAAPLSASPGPSFTWSGTSRAGCCEEADPAARRGRPPGEERRLSGAVL